jgi:hypothetical protein
MQDAATSKAAALAARLTSATAKVAAAEWRIRGFITR